MTVDEFIGKWEPSGGNERANTQLFITDLCALLVVDAPQPTLPDTQRNDYVFEKHVIKTEIEGSTSNGWIDLYKRDAFILEAKQGSQADMLAVDSGHGDELRDFFGQTAAERFKRGMAKRGTAQWTGAMQRAAAQADGYARALPDKHGWPPFLLVSDIGHCIDVYADFQRSGKGYAPFPDRNGYRITLDDLRDKNVRERLTAIWTDPMSLDPAIEAANVTRDVAAILAELAKRLERDHPPEKVAGFLMRLLFTMFAEDIGFGEKTLLPHGKFTDFLKRQAEQAPDLLPQALKQLWTDMDKGGFSATLGLKVSKFNGYLFKERDALPLTAGEIKVLIDASEQNWSKVEPAIFGTLLERALNPKERAKLGAHYTPRAYVERLVGPTIMEPLREDWLGARTAATEAAEAGDTDDARKLVEAFHGKLARTKVLDPACGTGNFLYVAMARMKELEGEVLDLLEQLGDKQYLAELSGHTITPENFLGIEINPRAAEIAQLVLWIGYLQWHFRVVTEGRMPTEPVLRDVRTIECRDALIEYDRKELQRDKFGKPITRWDGETMKEHPVTGKDVPDETAQIEVYHYINPRAAKWPEANFIVGNPPFIGNKRMRRRLGDGYVEGIRRAWPKVPGNVDFVMYWWHHAALIARKLRVRSFGFVSTNSIRQISNRVIINNHKSALDALSLTFAIPDHPWRDPDTDAAVRVAFTVASGGRLSGSLNQIEAGNRQGPDSWAPDLRETKGVINADLTVGSDTTTAAILKANNGLAFMGVIPVGIGFRFDPSSNGAIAAELIGTTYLRKYLGGSDLTDNVDPTLIIDVGILTEAKLSDHYPSTYDYLLNEVRPHRLGAERENHRTQWWRFGEQRVEMREAIRQLDRYIATTETSKHRIFSFLETEILPDQKIRIIALSDAYYLGVLGSYLHTTWAAAAGGRQGVGNDLVYNHSRCFDPFPFPDNADDRLKERIRENAENLDALRKSVLVRYPDLTLTKLYNVVDALRAAEAAGTVLSGKDRDVAERGCVSLIRRYHDAIDRDVAEAYGWGDLLVQEKGSPSTSSGRSDLGGTSASPSPGRTVWVAGADEIILERLVALNKERAAEEARGHVRWLRPEYQQAGYVAPVVQKSLDLPEEVKAGADILAWPSGLPEQVVAVAGVVERAGRPIDAAAVARAFKGKRAGSVTPVLDALAGMGRVRKLDGGRYAA